MNKDKITQNQYIFIIVGNMIGIGIAFLGSAGAHVAHQDAWISTLLCGIYPIIIVITASVIDKKSNHDDFWKMLKKVYGRILAFVILFIFFVYYITIFTSAISGFVNVLTHTITNFLPSYYIIVPCLFVITLITMSGLYMVGRTCEFYFYFTILFVLLLLFILPKGSILNIQPIFHSPKKISSGIVENFTQYSLVEISFITISRISNPKNTAKAGVKACLITTIIYTFVVFLEIYYLGWELTSRVDFPLFYMIGTISFPIISNLTSIFTFLWGLIVFKKLTCSSFFVSYCLSSFSGLSYKKACILSSCLVLICSYFMISEHNRIYITETYIKYFVTFSIIFGLVTSLLVPIRYRSKKHENK